MAVAGDWSVMMTGISRTHTLSASSWDTSGSDVVYPLQVVFHISVVQRLS